MIEFFPYILVFAGSALMVYNIYRYIKFAQGLRSEGGWENERRILYVPIVLLIMFLLGYLAVGFIGRPDLIVASILLGGSIFVFLMILFVNVVVRRVKENERLVARLSAAEESNRAKTSFFSSMSHEIRTPLNAIIGLNNMALRDESLSDNTRDKLEKIRLSADHLLVLINDVLDMSKIEAGEMELAEEPFSFQEMVDHVSGIIGSQCATKGLDYRCTVADNVDEYYLGDETKIKQVLINVLGNAVKFTNVPGSVTFAAEQVSSYGKHRTLRFTVADTGIGMDEEFLPNLFNAFAQEDGSRKSSYGGSGLGMAITKNIVDKMNGDIKVESQKGVGSTFVITITLDACEDGFAEGAEGGTGHDGSLFSEAEIEEALDGLRVLMAEDVELNAEILIDLLDLEGVIAEHAENGQVAVEMFERSEAGYYAAVLMDVRMPVMDGLEATGVIRSLDRPDAKSVPIIALTANAFEEDVERSLQAGMNAHLAKPIDPDLLYQTLAAFAKK